MEQLLADNYNIMEESISNNDGGGGTSDESEEEEIKMSTLLRAPDPCLLCGAPAVHYDVQGDVIKRESPSSSRLFLRRRRGDKKDDDDHEHDEHDHWRSSFIKCVFKCFRVGNRSHVEEEEEEEWVTTGVNAGPLPACDSCEELVLTLIEMYEKVEELEDVIRRKVRQAEGKFLEEELYENYDDDNGQGQGFHFNYGSFRGILFGGRNNKKKKEKGKKLVKCEDYESETKISMSGDSITLNSPSKNSNYGEADDAVGGCGDDDDDGDANITSVICEPSLVSYALQNDHQALTSPLDLETIGGGGGGGGSNPLRLVGDHTSRKRSGRTRSQQVVVTTYAESSSSSAEDEDTKDNSVDERRLLRKKKMARTPRRRRTIKETSDEKSKRLRRLHRDAQRRYRNRLNEKEGGGTGMPKAKSRGRPPNPDREIKNCKFDPSTGNISYTRTGFGGGNRNTMVKLNLEFIKQSSSSTSSPSSSKYQCSSCSRTVVFRPNMTIDRMALFTHARRFHAIANSGLCPVCGKPVVSTSNAAYYEHRLSHLSEEERVDALSNPVTKNGTLSRTPRFPPLERKRRITPESASLHHDVNQCPTCGKFVANGAQGLRRHEKTHLSSLAEKKCHLCAACGAGFTTKYVLDIHIIQHHSNGGDGNDDPAAAPAIKLYKCPVCKLQSRLFKTEKGLEAHMRKDVHDKAILESRGIVVNNPTAGGGGGGEKLLLPHHGCNQCGKSFRTPRALKFHVTKMHINAAANLGTWTCGNCLRKFGSKEERLEHYKEAHPKSKIAMKSRAPNESVRCEYPKCKQGFPDEASLRSHVGQVHACAGGAPTPAGFMCSLCGKVVSKEWVLKQHHLIHSGERKHVCEVCQASFPIRSTLLSHLASKHGQGPQSGTFKCEQAGCGGKVFRCRVQFKHHMRMVHRIFDGGRHPKKD